MSNTMSKDVKISPENIFRNWGYTEDWSNGNSSPPSDWLMTGTAGSVARETTIVKIGLYSMKITAGSSSTYAAELSSLNWANYSGNTITFGMWVYCGSANKARIYLKDGTQTVNSSYHTGDSTWQFLTVSIQVSLVNTQLIIGAQVAANGIVAYFNAGVAVVGEQIFTYLQAINNSNNTDVREVNISPSIKANLSTFDLARREGIFISNAKLGNRDLKISVQLWGSSFAVVRGYYDTLVKAVSEGTKDLYLANDRIIKVILAGISQIKYDADFQMYTVDIQFNAPKPYEEYIGRLRTKQQISITPTAFNVTYSGSYKNRPQVNVIALAGVTVTQCSLSNLTTGQVMSFSGTIVPGTTLMIDCEDQTVLNNGVDSIAQFQGAFLQLIPGTNYLSFAGSSCLIQVDRLEKWL